MTDSAPQMHSEAQGEAPGAGTACAWCDGLFTPTRRWNRFCKPGCRNAFNRATALPAVKEARELLRLALEGGDWQPRARKLLGIR